MSSNITPIQFIGTQRSGSNLLRVILNQFNEISAPHPPHILKTFYPLLSLYRDLNIDENFKSLVEDVCRWVNLNPVQWDVTLEPDRIHHLCTNRSLIEIFKNIYQDKARKDKALYWCCKSMESVYYYKEIEAEKLLPIYIHIYRDGRDVALSFTKAMVGPKHVYFLAKKWKEEQVLAAEIKKYVPLNRFIEVRYEDLIHFPELEIKKICLKLNIQYSKEALDFFHSPESIAAAQSGAMWSNLTKPIIPNNHDKFKDELTHDQMIIFESVAGPMLQALGYKTLYWPNQVKQFGQREIAAFKLEDELLRRAVINAASSIEIRRRMPQEELYQRIVNRKEIIV